MTPLVCLVLVALFALPFALGTRDIVLWLVDRWHARRSRRLDKLRRRASLHLVVRR